MFVNARGQPMTRAGFEYIVSKYGAGASESCATVREKRISPHVLRHTCALLVLRATKDIRAVALWLGHEDRATTEVHLRIDPSLRLAAAGSVDLPKLRADRFRAADRLIESLRGR